MATPLLEPNPRLSGPGAKGRPASMKKTLGCWAYRSVEVPAAVATVTGILYIAALSMNWPIVMIVSCLLSVSAGTILILIARRETSAPEDRKRPS